MSAKQQAYEHVKRVVLKRELMESGFLTEAELAAELGISRTPVREAFRALEAEGLIELVRNKGAFVPPVTDRQIVDVMDARILVETFSARRAVELGREPVAELEELLAEQRACGDAVDVFIECDRRFHMAIVRAGDNRILENLYESLRDRQVRMGIRAVVSSSQRLDAVIAEHVAIVEALAARDAERATKAIETHLEATKHVLLGDRGAK